MNSAPGGRGSVDRFRLTRRRPGEDSESELPFVIAVLAPLGGSRPAVPSPGDRRLVDVRSGELSEVFAAVAPSLTVRIDDVLSGRDALIDVPLRPRSLEDLETDGLARQIPTLAPLVALRDALRPEPGAPASGEAAPATGGSALDAVLAASESAGPLPPVDWRRELPSVLAGRVGDPARARAVLDRAVEAQVARLRLDDAFQALEAAWRGLAWLAARVEPLDGVRLRALDLSKKEAYEDLAGAESVEDATPYRRLVADGLLGGREDVEPVGLIVADWSFTLHPQDLDLLHGCAWIAASGYAPFLASAAPSMFGVERFRDLPSPGDIQRHFDSPKATKWRSFRESEDARWLSLVLPGVRVSDEPRHPIGGPLVVAAALACSFHRTGFWFEACESAEQCLCDLPANATDVDIDERRQRTLDQQGFLPICRLPSTSSPCLVSLHSAQRARLYSAQNVQASASAERLSRLPEALFTGRFSHYLTLEAAALARHPDEALSSALNEWLRRWVAVPGAEAGHPLTAAGVEVRPLPQSPGYRAASVHLEPMRGLTPENHASGLRFALVLPR